MLSKAHMRVALILISMFLLAGCASVPLADPQANLLAKELKPLPDKALVYVLRKPAVKGSGAEYRAEANGTIIGRMLNSNYVYFYSCPGNIKVEIVQDYYTNTSDAVNFPEFYFTKTFKAEPGKTYYISLEKGLGGSSIRMLDEQTGRQRLEGYSLVRMDSTQTITPQEYIQSKQRECESVWQDYVERNTKAGYEEFLAQYQHCGYDAKAKKQFEALELENVAFEHAKAQGTIVVLSGYLDSYPHSVRRKEALMALAPLLTKKGNTAQIASMAKTHPGLIDYLPLKYSLALIGPPGLTVAEVVDIKKQGLEDRLISAQIRSTGAAYRKFSLKEIMALKKMGLSAEVIEAMIDSTTEARRAQAQADYMKKLESLNAQQQAKLEELKLKMDQMQKAQAFTTSTSSTQGGGGAGASNCAARAGAVQLCKQTTGGMLQMVCISAAKAKFPCN
ncbi:MAG: hypothetical protein KAR83_07390 [Thermodesulfovibrionales bacterium]|nr:hypothetical protein [Thermodesulfovibrionales bacterium]